MAWREGGVAEMADAPGLQISGVPQRHSVGSNPITAAILILGLGWLAWFLGTADDVRAWLAATLIALNILQLVLGIRIDRRLSLGIRLGNVALAIAICLLS